MQDVPRCRVAVLCLERRAGKEPWRHARVSHVLGHSAAVIVGFQLALRGECVFVCEGETRPRSLGRLRVRRQTAASALCFISTRGGSFVRLAVVRSWFHTGVRTVVVEIVMNISFVMEL